MTPQELKNSILHLAIQGKLVEQRPEEGTAEELYRRIQEEKQRLIEAGTIKKEKPLPEITEDEKPFDIPESWKWVRTGNIGSWSAGATPSRTTPQYYDGNIPWLKTGDLNDGYVHEIPEFISELALEKTSVRLNPIGTVLMAMYGATIGKLGILEIEATTNQACCACIPFNGIYNKYLFYYLMAKRITFIKMGAGGAQPNISKDKIANSLISLPPLAEQKRIVAKIEELLPYIDRYEKAWNKLETFNKCFPMDMQKSILQFAIQGRLVEQRPEEGNGEELYRQIQAEKQRLIEAGIIKKEKPLPEITEDEKPFDIPENWKWVRLPEIGELNRGRSQHRPRNDPSLYINGTVPMIQTGDVARANKYIINWSVMYNDSGVAQSRIWKAGTVCLTIAANIGDVAILAFDACFPDSVVGFNAYKPIESNEYLLYGLMWYKTMLDTMSRSTAQKNINIEILSQIAFPLPPLAEQKRIVAKLEEILPLCEKLKK